MALAVAIAAQLASRGGPVDPNAYLKALRAAIDPTTGHELIDLVTRAVRSAGAGQSTQDFATELGLAQGVSGYVLHTVPVAVHCWLASRRFPPGSYRNHFVRRRYRQHRRHRGRHHRQRRRQARDSAGLATRIWEWPFDCLDGEFGRSFISRANHRNPRPTAPVAGLWRFIANPLFTSIVLFHGFRRLLPPY